MRPFGLISVIGLAVSTPVIIIYELLLLVGVLKRRSYVVRPEGFYKVIRWLFGLLGAVSMIWTIYTVFDMWSHYQPPKTGVVANFVTLDN